MSRGSLLNKMGKKADLVQDPRFAKIHTDPRFRLTPKEIEKFAVDERFKPMFTEKRFQGAVPTKVDSKGRKVKATKNDLAKVYDVKDIDCIDEEGQFKWDVESSSEEEVLDEYQELPQVWKEPDAPVSDESTSRIAVMNCDWRGINSTDLFVLFSSFCKDGGRVVKVEIMPSEFGMQRMKQEEISGPSAADLVIGEGVDADRLRQFEIDQMKYYYAVISFDSIDTAVKVYEECDGLEIERTSNCLDLRFIPDSLTEFPYPPRDNATQAPKNYKLKDFYTRALQSSRVELTWDETPLERKEALQRAFTADNLDDLDLREYLATPTESEASDAEIKNDEDEPAFEKLSQFKRMRKDDVELEITFNTAFDDAAQHVKDRQSQPEDETAWEKYQRTKKEKKVARKKERTDQRKAEAGPQDNAHLELLVENPVALTSEAFDTEDPRFSKIYKDSRFGIDPTSNMFKRDREGNQELLKKQAKRRKVTEE